MTKNRRLSVLASAFAAAAVVLAASSANADIDKKALKQLRGTILVSADELPPIDGAGVTVQSLKKAHQTTQKSVMSGDIATWKFYFVAFLKKKPGVTQLSFDFYTTDKRKLFVANKRLTGIDRSLTLLSSMIEITEDDGLTRGKTYTVKLTATKGKREVVLATTKLSMQ